MMEIILWVGFSQSLFAAILISAKKNIAVSDRILVAWLSLLAIEFLTCIFDYKIFGVPLLSSSFLLFNPAFYLYVKSLTDRNFKIKIIQLLHLLPFLFFEIFAYVIKETISLNYFFETDKTFGFRLVFAISNIFSWLIYNLLIIKILFKHRKYIFHEFSNLQIDKSLGWILFIVFFYNIYCISVFIIGATVVITGDKILLPHIYNYSVLLFLIYILGFYGLRQSVIYKKSSIEAGIIEKYKKSILDKSQKNKIKTKLLKYFETEKPYLNPDFNMDILSEDLSIPKYHITEVLNMEIGYNFFTFVNKYRIELVKEMLKDESNLYSIEAIGYECGFNSKSSFFTVFKKITGLTPQQYRNNSDSI